MTHGDYGFHLLPSLCVLFALFRFQQPSSELTFLHSKGIKNLNALAYSRKKQYFCIEMSGKGSISRMSDECLMKQETAFSFYIVYQAVMRKFTLAGKSVSAVCRFVVVVSCFRQ